MRSVSLFKFGIGNGNDGTRGSFKHTEDSLFTRSVTTLCTFPSYTLGFVAPLTANERFVDLNCSVKLIYTISGHHSTQVMEHTMDTSPLNSSNLSDTSTGAVTKECSDEFTPREQRCSESFDTCFW